MTLPDNFRCFLVRRIGKEPVETSLESRPLRDLPAGDLVVRVAYSSVNYKDALAATGHPGIVRDFPHVPGIDAAGYVAASEDPRFSVGDPVVVTGRELGVERWGGWAEYIRIPADWALPLPEGLTLRDSMTLGTAGFTAAQCVTALQLQGITPDRGTVVVTGATGGVGSLSVAILGKLGYEVTAVTGKADKHDWLKSLGATQIAGRELLADDSGRPLLSTRFAGGIDTVGGATLSALVRSIEHRGCVACCGVAGGADLPLTVYPFILRGVTLSGIDSAWCPDEPRREIWQKLSGDWKPPQLDSLTQVIQPEELEATVGTILEGGVFGRRVVEFAGG